jgi:hypothetical protein
MSVWSSNGSSCLGQRTESETSGPAKLILYVAEGARFAFEDRATSTGRSVADEGVHLATVPVATPGPIDYIMIPKRTY